MTINGISGAYSFYGSYRGTVNGSAIKVSASENGSFGAISTKVSSALTDEYIEQIQACARQAAADGTNMIDSGYAAMRDEQMKQCVSPDRTKAISQVSAMINNPNLVLLPGENLFDLLSIPYSATISNGALYGTHAEIYNADGEMVAAYGSFGWTNVPTEDESRFQYESNQIYREAYNAAKAEMANAAQQTATPAVSGGASANFDIKA